MLSTDAGILRESDVRERMKKYGALADKLFIIVIASQGSRQSEQIAPNVWVYPVVSSFRVWALAKAIIRGISICKKHQPQVISSQDPFEQGLVGYFISRISRVPLQLQVHTDFLSRYFISESFVNRLRVFIARRLLPRANSIRVVSKRIAESLQTSLSLSRVTVLPIYVSPHSFSNSEHKHYEQFDFVILIASRLTKEKDIDTALMACAPVIAQYPKTGIIVAGTGPLEGDLKKKVAEMGIDNNVVFEGWQNLAPLYQAADLFVVSSLYEGYGLTLIEAALSGCPIISTDVGIAREIIKDGVNGFIVPVRDWKRMSERILDARKMSLTSGAEQEKARIEASLPSWDEYCEAYKNSFRV